MRHEQEYDDMNQRDRDRHRDERNRRPENLQDARSRWGEPDPRMGPHADDWRRADEERRQHDIAHRQDWKPFEQRSNRHFQDEDRDRRYGYGNEQQQDWQQHNDDRYRGYNQHADDRWNQQNEIRQHHHPRHASEHFYREQRRRNW